MSDIENPNEPGLAAKVADGVTDAKQMAGNVKDAFESAEFPNSVVQLISDATRARPIAMLGLAFMAGVMFTRRRRY